MSLPIIQIHDRQPPGFAVVDPRHMLALLGERTLNASWRVAGVARDDEDVMIVGGMAADQLKEHADSQSPIAGAVLIKLIIQTTQIIWGEFSAYMDGVLAPWIIIRAIDSSWCEVETQEDNIRELLCRSFEDVRHVPEPSL